MAVVMAPALLKPEFSTVENRLLTCQGERLSRPVERAKRMTSQQWQWIKASNLELANFLTVFSVVFGSPSAFRISIGADVITSGELMPERKRLTKLVRYG